MTSQAPVRTAARPARRGKYPRRLGGRLIRFFLRILWLLGAIAALAGVAPNAVALVDRYGIGALIDPARWPGLVNFPQLAPVTGLFPGADVALGIAAGVIFLLAILAAILAGRDARRERRVLRQRRDEDRPSLPVAPAATRSETADAAAVPPAPASASSPPDVTGPQPAPEPAAAGTATPAAATAPPEPAAAPSGWTAVPAQANPWYATATRQDTADEPGGVAGSSAASRPPRMSDPVAGAQFGPPAGPIPARPDASPSAAADQAPWLPVAQQHVPAAPASPPSGAPSTPLGGAWQRAQGYIGQLSQPLAVENVAVSPAPYAASAPGWTQDRDVQDRQLGMWIDGWSDTVVGMAEHAPFLIQTFVADMPSHLNARTWAVSTRLGVTGLGSLAQGIDIPPSPQGVVRILTAIGPAVGALPRAILQLFGLRIIGRQRDYLFTAMTPGAAVGINISATGRDLYIAWDLFIRRVWNEVAVGMIALLAILVGSLAGVGAVEGLKHTVGATTGLLVGGFVGAFLVGGFFATLGAIALLVVLGVASRRDPLAVFLKDIDFFEGHDVRAMVIGVHKALLAAADRAGIDKSLLRAKEQYRVDRRGRLI